MAKKKQAKASAKKAKRSSKTRSVSEGGSRKRAAKKPAAAKAKPAPKEEEIALGRVLVTQEEKLYMLFKEDYHARQIFEFLRVETVKDLEQFSPQEIVKRLSQPIQTTVQRIRQKLAEKNRHLLGDEAFAAQFKEKQRQ
jgi:hypothetical protein